MREKRAHKPVGRPREFDEGAVLEAAMKAFLENGYEATSLADLCRCTGLHKGSLYQAFGDKHELFMKALRRYDEEEFRDVAAVAFQHESPLENIRAAMYRVVDNVLNEKGCLMLNSTVELAPHDPKVKELVVAATERRLRVLMDMVEKAQELGELRKGLPPERAAQRLMVAVAGVATMIRGSIDKEQGLAIIEDVIGSLM